EDSGLSERRAIEIVAGQSFFGDAIEGVQYVQEQVQTPNASTRYGSRDAQIQKCLRRESPRTARFEQHPRVALRQRDLRTRRPRFPAQELNVARDDEPGAWNLPGRCGPEHVRAIVRQSSTRIGEAVRIAPERSATERAARLSIRRRSAARRLK